MDEFHAAEILFLVTSAEGEYQDKNNDLILNKMRQDRTMNERKENGAIPF